MGQKFVILLHWLGDFHKPIGSHTTAFFVLPGKPCSYKPPRFVKNKRGNVYAGHNATIKPAREVLANQMQSPALRDVPLVAHIEFYFKRPQTHYKKGQLKSDAPLFVLKTPDVDNCVKFALDALQPRVVFDDKIVTKVVAEKKWCDGASAECTTIELLVRYE